MKNAHKTRYAEPYTEKWLKELTEAMSVPSFKFTPAKEPLLPENVLTPDTRYEYKESKQKHLTQKQQSILIIAQSFPKNY